MEHKIRFANDSNLPRGAAERLTHYAEFIVCVRPEQRTEAGSKHSWKHESLEAVAQVCGFPGGYRELLEYKNTPGDETALDEELPLEQLAERRAFQAERLAAWFESRAPGFRPNCAALVADWQPTARRPQEDAKVRMDEGGQEAFAAACKLLATPALLGQPELSVLKVGLRYGADRLMPGALSKIRSVAIELERSRHGPSKRVGTELVECLAAIGDAPARAHYAKVLNDCGEYEAALRHAKSRRGDGQLHTRERAALAVQEARARLQSAYHDGKRLPEAKPAQMKDLPGRMLRELEAAFACLSGIAADDFETHEARGEWLTWLAFANFTRSVLHGDRTLIAKGIALFGQIAEQYGDRHAASFHASLVKRYPELCGAQEDGE